MTFEIPPQRASDGYPVEGVGHLGLAQMANHTMDYKHLGKSQLAQKKMTFRPFMVTYHADFRENEMLVVIPG